MLTDIILNLALLVASISALVFVAEKLINHSVKLASILGVSGAVVGLTLLAYGTTIPEFTISVLSSIEAHDQLSVSNILGTNIYNIAMVIGLVAIISPFAWKEDLRLEGLLMVAGAFGLIPLASRGGISSSLGAMMALLIVGYTYYILKTDKEKVSGKVKKAKGSAKKEFLWCCILLGGVILSAKFTVDFAVQLSRYAGISEWIIGSTIVAAGTSVPETVVSLMAAKKKQMGMSVGNIVGANYFNAFWTLGISATLGSLAFSLQEIWIDLAFLCVLTTFFFIVLLKRSVSRYEGLAFVLIYVMFVVYLLTAAF